MPSRLTSFLKRLALRSNQGNVAVIFAISMPLVIGGAGLGVETTYWQYRQTQLQVAADAAAFSAAMEKRRGSGDIAIATSAATASGQNGFPTPGTTVSVTFPATPNSVRVALSSQTSRFFTAYFSTAPVTLRAVAVANYSQTGQACILALDQSASSALNISGSATVTLQSCSMMANSISATAATTGGSSKVTVPCIISGGGVSLGGTVTLTECDEAITEAAQAPDPYKTVAQPVPTGSCKNMGNGATINPDYYCDLDINKTVNLNAGIYFVRDSMKWNGNAVISGDGVTIVLLNSTRADINGTTKVALKAPSTGTYAGILFFGSRSSTGGSRNVFNGTNDSLMTGALYFPTQAMEYKGNFSGQGGCTQVVANTVEWIGNATLSMNCSALGLKTVPIPGAVRLIG